LINIATLGIPARLLHRRAGRLKRKKRRHVPNIKPHLLPVDDLVTQLVRDISWLLPLMKLQPSASNYIYLRVIGMRFQMKEILEQIEMRFDPEERLAEMDKDRNMKNRIRGQVMYLNPPVVKKASEEIRNGKTEAPKNMRMKNNRFIFTLMRKGLPIGSPPMDHVLGFKKMLLYKTEQMGVGTLT
jgi:hypothetical protein